VFNVNNGVLRDFAMGKNHLFGHVMSSLTGEPWKSILDRYEKETKTPAGRPHSRRISFPTDKLTAEERIPLDVARANLEAYYHDARSFRSTRVMSVR